MEKTMDERIQEATAREKASFKAFMDTVITASREGYYRTGEGIKEYEIIEDYEGFSKVLKIVQLNGVITYINIYANSVSANAEQVFRLLAKVAVHGLVKTEVK